MAERRWKKSPPELVVSFDHALPRHAAVERRQMFGYPCAFVRGQMFCGLFQDRVLVRLGTEAAATLVSAGETDWFTPMPGRPMREYVLVPDADAEHPAQLAAWLERALRYGLTLPPKSARAPTAPKSATEAAPVRPASKRVSAKKAPSSKSPEKPATGKTAARKATGSRGR